MRREVYINVPVKADALKERSVRIAVMSLKKLYKTPWETVFGLKLAVKHEYSLVFGV